MPKQHPWIPALREVTKVWKEMANWAQDEAIYLPVDQALEVLGRHGFRAMNSNLEGLMEALEAVCDTQFRFDPKTGRDI